MQIVIKSLRGLNKGHLRFRDFLEVEIIEKAVVRAATTFQMAIQSERSFCIGNHLCFQKLLKLPSSLDESGNFSKFLETHVILILNFSRPYAITVPFLIWYS